jgi:hypothetical protein
MGKEMTLGLFEILGGKGSGNKGHSGGKGGPGNPGGSTSTKGKAKKADREAKGKAVSASEKDSRWRSSLAETEHNAVREWLDEGGPYGVSFIRAQQISGKKSDLTKNFETAIDKHPNDDGGTLYRGLMDLSEADVKSIIGAKEITWNAHSSATTSKGVADSNFAEVHSWSHSVLFTIHAKTGVALSRTKFGLEDWDEDEVLMKKGTRYNVKSVKTVSFKDPEGTGGGPGYKHYVTLEEK